MRTNTHEAILSAYIVSIGKRTPRDAAQAGRGNNGYKTIEEFLPEAAE